MTTVGTSIFSGVLSSAAAGAQVTGADGQQRQATEEEAAMIKKLMDSQTQPQIDAVYQEKFADPTDHAGVQEVVNKRTAALTATEETYATTDKETIYCGSGRTGICINGSDTIEIEQKTPTASDLVEHVIDQLNPFSSMRKSRQITRPATKRSLTACPAPIPPSPPSRQLRRTPPIRSRSMCRWARRSRCSLRQATA